MNSEEKLLKLHLNQMLIFLTSQKPKTNTGEKKKKNIEWFHFPISSTPKFTTTIALNTRMKLPQNTIFLFKFWQLAFVHLQQRKSLWNSKFESLSITENIENIERETGNHKQKSSEL